MKKIILLFICLMIPILTALAENKKYLTPPSWSEFCPYQYLHAKIFSDDEIEYLAQRNDTEKTDILYCKHHGKTTKIIKGITIIPAVDCWMARKLQISNSRK